MSTNTVNTEITIKSRLSKPNQIATEQTKDRTLVQFKAKMQKEDYSEELLQQDVRYKHYLRNSERIVLREEVLARLCFDKTGQITYYQVLLPQHLVAELLEPLIFPPISILMDNLTGPMIGLMLLLRNHTVLDMRRGKLLFPNFSVQLKTADHKHSNVTELILNT